MQTVDGVLTSDSDALLYGAKKVYRKLKMDVSWVFLTRTTITSRYIKLYSTIMLTFINIGFKVLF